MLLRMSENSSRRNPIALFLDLIEAVGNRLPDPITLFGAGALFILVLSHVGYVLEWEVAKPTAEPAVEAVLDAEGEPIEVFQTEPKGRTVALVTDKSGTPVRAPVTEPTLSEDGKLIMKRVEKPVRAKSLLSAEGLRWVLDNLVNNFTGFHPLGVVLVAMLGIGVAEKTGMIGALLKSMMLITPRKLLNPAMVFIGIMSSMAADAGYVVLPPIAAALYKAVGKSPLVGIAAVFSGVAAGFSANLMVTSLDPLLAGLSTVGAQITDPTYVVDPTANWWFMIASTFLLTLIGWGVTSLFVEPRFNHKPAEEGGPSPLTDADRKATVLESHESRGLIAAGGFGAVAVVASLGLIALIYGSSGWGDAVIPALFFIFLSIGLGYGISTGSILTETKAKRLDEGIARLMASSMADMGPYIVLAFFAAQFIAFFNHSQLGVMLAVVGGNALAAAQLPPELLMAAFILVAMAGNLFIGSASAKYAFFAPVFVPMFMAAGISPELTQAAYRVGDSATNIITPLNPYFVVILVFMQKYVPKAGLGTLVSMMLPYSIAFWLAWTVMLLVWMTLQLELGPGAPLLYVDPLQAVP